MTKISLVLMMCLLFTSSLVCTMNACPVMAQITDAEISEQELCHGMSDAKGVSLVIDCMDMDLFQNEIDQELTGTQNLDSYDSSWSVIASDYQFQIEYLRDIRGSPYFTYNAQPQIPLLLSTQRLRI